jgi:hypothetical protein
MIGYRSTKIAVLRNQENRDLFALRRQERVAEATMHDLERRLTELSERLEQVAQDEERSYRRMHFGHGPHENGHRRHEDVPAGRGQLPVP